MRTLIATLLMFLAVSTAPASAQVRDGVFVDYASFDGFMTQTGTAGDFDKLLTALGARQSMTDTATDQMAERLSQLFPERFENAAVFREEDLGNGLRQEGRVFWTGDTYLFVYAALHRRADSLRVLDFAIETTLAPVMAKF